MSADQKKQGKTNPFGAKSAPQQTDDDRTELQERSSFDDADDDSKTTLSQKEPPFDTAPLAPSKSFDSTAQWPPRELEAAARAAAGAREDAPDPEDAPTEEDVLEVSQSDIAAETDRPAAGAEAEQRLTTVEGRTGQGPAETGRALDEDLAELFNNSMEPADTVEPPATRQTGTPTVDPPAADGEVVNPVGPTQLIEPAVSEAAMAQAAEVASAPAVIEVMAPTEKAVIEIVAPTPAAIVEVAAPAPTPTPAGPEQGSSEAVLQERLVAERDENSVLFSRKQLNELIKEIDASKEGEEEVNSALINIRQVIDEADSRPTSFEAESGPTNFEPVVGPAAVPILIPEDEEKKRKVGIGTIVLINLAGLLLLAGVAVGLLYLTKPEMLRALTGGANGSVEGGEARRGDPAPRAASGGDDRDPPRDPELKQPPEQAPPPAVPPATDRPTSADPGGRRHADSPRRKDRRRPVRAPAADAPPTAPKTVATPPAPVSAPPDRPTPPPTVTKKKPSELDDLIEAATKGKVVPRPGKQPAAKPAPPASTGWDDDLPRTLTRAQINAGMKRASFGVQDCKSKFGGGRITATIKVSISGARGRIQKAHVVGPHAGTAGGQCVVDSVRFAAKFPRFSGPPITLSFPFIIK